jgi:hypothetical protein
MLSSTRALAVTQSVIPNPQGEESELTSTRALAAG